jgi:streptogramin lyase
VWFVDQDNKLDRLDTASGEILTLDRFAKDSEIVVLAAGSRALYAVDAANSRLYTFSFDDERLQFRYLPFVARPQTMAVAPDGRIWFGLIGTGQILIYDPEKKTSETLASDLLTLRKLAFDDRGAAWFTDGGRKVSTYDVATRRLTTFLMPVTGNIQQLLPDASGQVWVGSSTGEISAIQGGSSRLVLNVRRPVTDLALDPIGSAWFLSPGAPGLGGFMYGPVDGSQLETVPGPATSLAFSTAGRAWLADPAGGFFLQLEAR